MVRFALLLSLFVVVLSAGHAQADPPRRPHVLLIMADDLGWMDLHCQGNQVLRTPHLDQLAAQGMRFTDAYAASPVCSPTRAAIMTGLAPARLHITQHGPDGKQFWPENRKVQPPASDNTLPLQRITLAERLKESGYATGFFGKWHLGDKKEFWPLAHGFDINIGGCGFGGPPTFFDPYRIPTITPRKTGEYLTDRLADETITWMNANKQQPMFICLWTYNPHYPFEAPAELVQHYKGKEGPGLKNPIYGGQIEATDRGVGRVIEHLDKLKIADNTLVIFTSDNGGWLGATDNRPLRLGKGYLYEGGLRVPLIIRWPGVTKAGTTSAVPVISMDLTATIRDAANVKLSDGESLDGRSLKKTLAGGKLDRDALYFHYPHFAFHKDNRPGSAMRMHEYKLIMNHDDGSIELYNVVKDISEKKNLAAEMPDQAAMMKAKLQAWFKATDAHLPQARP